jgi:anti-sigma regulatory factor (Ser/Thr protein kinase)
LSDDPSHLAVARAFVGATSRAAGHPESLSDDLRLALSELLTVLIRARIGEMVLELSEADGQFRVSVTGSGPLPPAPAETVELVARLFGSAPHLAETEWRIEVPSP